MTQSHNLVVLVSVLALLLFFATGLGVARARIRHGAPAPAMTGPPEFERAFRVQMNTLEQLVIFLPSLWMFAHYWNDLVAAGAGVVWLAGRLIYWNGYVKAAEKRGPGFGISMLGTAVLLFGAAAGAIRSIAATGAL